MSILLLCTGRIHGGSHSTSRFLSSTHPHHNHNGALEKEHARLKRRGGLPGPLLDVCGPRSRVWRKATPPLFAHTLGSVSSVRHTSNNVGQRATSQQRSHWDKVQHTPKSTDAGTADVQACGVQEPTEVGAGRTLNHRTQPRPRRHIATIAPLLFRAITIQRSTPLWPFRRLETGDAMGVLMGAPCRFPPLGQCAGADWPRTRRAGSDARRAKTRPGEMMP